MKHPCPRSSVPSRPVARAARTLAAGAAFALAASAHARDDVTMEVAWTDDRCDFVVSRDAHGYGIAMRLTPLALRSGDVLVGALDEIGYGRKIAKQGTDDAAMMQIRKYGIRRKVALDLVYDWSRQCNPPEE